MSGDDEAQAQCDTHCKHFVGPEWSWDGQWWQHDILSWSHCSCWKNDCDCVVPVENGVTKYHFERWGCLMGWVTASEEGPHCSPANTDRYAGRGACCEGLVEKTEARPTDDPLYCPDTDKNHNKTCYSTRQMCRAADWNGTCSPENADRRGGLGACCAGLVEDADHICRKDPDLEFGTCVGDSLASCSWDERNSDYHRTFTATSPKHCGVTQVMLYIAGGATSNNDVYSDQWMGVKLVDEQGRVVASYSRSHNNHFVDKVLWDDLPGSKCYRVVVQDGQTGDGGHIAIQDVQFWSTAPQRMLRDIDSRAVTNGESADWSETKGDKVMEFDVTWGVDAYGNDHSGIFTIGASYISETGNMPTVVTDLFLAVSDYEEVDCPDGYERTAFWDPDNGDRRNWNAKTDIVGDHMSALCVKKEPCSFGKQYVSLVEAETVGQKNIESKTQNGCEIIGSWDPQSARSYTSGQSDTWTTALYQCKKQCPQAQCHSVNIRVLEKSSPEKMEEDSAASGSSISLVEDYANCVGEAEEHIDVNLALGEATENTSSYTLSKSLQSSFESSMTNSVSISAEVGFKAWGVDVSTSVSAGVSTSKTEAFSTTTSKDSTNLHSTTTAADVEWANGFDVPAGYIAHYRVNMTAIAYSTSFVAVSDCLDENNRVLETRKLEGVFRGRTFKSSATAEIKHEQCPAGQCECHKVY